MTTLDLGLPLTGKNYFSVVLLLLLFYHEVVLVTGEYSGTRLACHACDLFIHGAGEPRLRG